jgi:hypothetical protein
MKKIVIENITFDLELGKRLLKLKYNTCPFPELENEWDNIQPISFAEISELDNLEERRVGVLCLGIERLAEQVNPTLLHKAVVKKTNTVVNEKGELETYDFDDVYELFEVNGEVLNKNQQNSWNRMRDCHFVKCKDTSTNREYMIWVDIASVFLTNKEAKSYYDEERDKNKVNAVQAIAWTIQTNIAKGDIKKIVRQGDCVLIKPKNKKYLITLSQPRHLTEKEYLSLMVAES